MYLCGAQRPGMIEEEHQKQKAMSRIRKCTYIKRGTVACVTGFLDHLQSLSKLAWASLALFFFCHLLQQVNWLCWNAQAGSIVFPNACLCEVLSRPFRLQTSYAPRSFCADSTDHGPHPCCWAVLKVISVRRVPSRCAEDPWLETTIRRHYWDEKKIHHVVRWSLLSPINS